MNLSALDGNLYHAVLAVFEQPIGFVDAFEREAVGDQWRCVDKALLYKMQYLGAVAAVDAARFEREVFAVHIWQRQHLRTVVQSHYGDNGIRAGTLPCKTERIVGTGNLDDTIGAAVVAVTTDKIDALFWRGYQNGRVVVTHELRPQRRLLAYDDTLRLLQHYAQQSAYSRRACADDGDGILRRYLRYACGPESGGEDVSHEERLIVAYGIWYSCQPLIGVRDTYILGLPAVDAATQRPSTVGIGTVVHISMTAEETLATEGLDINRHAVAHLYGGYGTAYGLDYADHLVPDGYALDGAGNAAVLDVQVARADASEGYAHDGITRVLDLGPRLVPHLEASAVDIGVCFHSKKGILSTQS